MQNDFKIEEFFNPTIALDKTVLKELEKYRNGSAEHLADTFMKNPTDRNFEKLMEKFDERLRKFCKGYVKSDDAVDDVMSRTMENVYFKRDTFNRNIAKFSTWVFRIAFVNCIKYLNNEFDTCITKKIDADISDIGELNFNNVSSIYDIEDSDVENLDMLYEDGKFIRFDGERIFNEMYNSSVESIDSLPENVKAVMKERYINKKKLNRIAEDNGISLYSVKNWIRKGNSMLYEEVKKNHPEIFSIYGNYFGGKTAC